MPCKLLTDEVGDIDLLMDLLLLVDRTTGSTRGSTLRFPLCVLFSSIFSLLDSTLDDS